MDQPVVRLLKELIGSDFELESAAMEPALPSAQEKERSPGDDGYTRRERTASTAGAFAGALLESIAAVDREAPTEPSTRPSTHQRPSLEQHKSVRQSLQEPREAHLPGIASSVAPSIPSSQPRGAPLPSPSRSEASAEVSEALARLEAKERECSFYKDQNRLLISRMTKGTGTASLTPMTATTTRTPATTPSLGMSARKAGQGATESERALGEKLERANEANEALRAKIEKLTQDRSGGSRSDVHGVDGVVDAARKVHGTADTETLSSVQAERDSLLLEVGMLRSRYDPNQDGGRHLPRRAYIQSRGCQTGPDERFSSLNELLDSLGQRCIFMEDARDLALGQMSYMHMRNNALQVRVHELEEKLGRLEYQEILRAQKESTLPLAETPNVENIRTMYFTKILKRHERTMMDASQSGQAEAVTDTTPTRQRSGGKHAATKDASGAGGGGVGEEEVSAEAHESGEGRSGTTTRASKTTSETSAGGGDAQGGPLTGSTRAQSTPARRPKGTKDAEYDFDEDAEDSISEFGEGDIDGGPVGSFDMSGRIVNDENVEEFMLDQFEDFLSTPAGTVAPPRSGIGASESASGNAALGRASKMAAEDGGEPRSSYSEMNKKKKSRKSSRSSASVDRESQRSDHRKRRDGQVPAGAKADVQFHNNNGTKQGIKSLKSVAAVDARLAAIQSRRQRVLQSLIIEDAALVAREELEEAELIRRRKKLVKREATASAAR